MKNNLRLLSVIVLIVMLAISGIVFAETGYFETYSGSGENDWKADSLLDYSIEEKNSGEVISDETLEMEISEVLQTDQEKNIMLLGKKLNITGEARDLIMAAGETITSKALGSYAFMAATQLDISGEIFKDTFAVGNEVIVSGNIGRDFYALGNTISIDGTIERDLYAGGESLTISGNIGGDIHFAGRSVYIASSTVIAGDLNLMADEIKIEEGSTIGGTVTYRSDAVIVSIPSDVKTNVIQAAKVEKPTENKILSALKSLLWWIVSNFIVMVVLMLICPKLFERIEEVYKEDTVQKYCSSCGWGVLSLILVPLISILAILTFVGSTVGMIGLLLYIIGYVIATVIVGYAISNTILENVSNRYVRGLVGIVIIEILRRLPIIGFLVSIIVNSIAFGTIIKLLKNESKKEPEVVEKIDD